MSWVIDIYNGRPFSPDTRMMTVCTHKADINFYSVVVNRVTSGVSRKEIIVARNLLREQRNLTDEQLKEFLIGKNSQEFNDSIYKEFAEREDKMESMEDALKRVMEREGYLWVRSYDPLHFAFKK